MDQKTQEDHQSQYLHKAIRDPRAYEFGIQKIELSWEVNMFLLFSAKSTLRSWAAMKRDKERIVPGYFLSYTAMRSVILESNLFARLAVNWKDYSRNMDAPSSEREVPS